MKKGGQNYAGFIRKRHRIIGKVQKVPEAQLGSYALAAMAFVFAGNILLTIIIVALDIFLEIKLYRCPHCGKGLDCRRRVNEDTVCPKCEKYIFRGL